MKKIEFTIEGNDFEIKGNDFEVSIKVHDTNKTVGVSELDSAAIATALSMYYGKGVKTRHITPKESAGTTARKNSPWSSKIFGFNNLQR